MSTERRDLVVFGLTLALLAWLTHATVFWAGNDASRFAQIEALVDFGHTYVDESWYRWTVDRVTLDGHDYSNKPPLQSLAGAGVYVLLKPFGPSFATAEGTVAYLLTLMIVGVPVAWLTASFDAALATYPDIRPAVRNLTTLAMAAGTLVTVFASTFTNHALAAALLFAACRAAWLGRGAVAGGWLAATTGVDLVPGLVFVPFLAGLLYESGGCRALQGYFLTLAAGAALLMVVNELTVGSPLPPKLAPGALDHSSHYPPPAGGVQVNVPFNLLPEDWLFPWQCLFGWHGFFTVSPVLLFGAWGMALAVVRGGPPLGRRSAGLLVDGSGLMIAGHLLFVATYGGWSYGYRYLVPIMPIILLFAPRARARARGVVQRRAGGFDGVHRAGGLSSLAAGVRAGVRERCRRRPLCLSGHQPDRRQRRRLAGGALARSGPERAAGGAVHPSQRAAADALPVSVLPQQGLSRTAVKLSVVIPCYNEVATLSVLLDRVRAAPVEVLEIIVVDDGSTDGTRELLQGGLGARVDRVIYHDCNRGKGAAVRSALAAVSGEVVVIQDADLEYDPQEYPRLLAPILEHGADVVYGSRFVGSDSHRVLYFWHMVGNRLLTLFSNLLTNLNLSDVETGYKMFRREAVADIDIEEDRFGVEPELTAKLAQKGCIFYEVGISYHGRTYEQGKKIGWRDGLRALYVILKYNLRPRRLEKGR